MVPALATSARVRQVIEALDGTTLGHVYCDDGGDAFWADRREPVIELGVRWASELTTRLPRGGHSIYVGAGVAELPAMIVEILDLDRTVTACNLRAEECDSINGALAKQELDLRLQHIDASAVTVDADHISLVSVLCDPETFPIVSDLTYGRLHPALVDAEAFVAERDRVRQLAHAVLNRLRLPGLVTTTIEEVPWVLEWAERAGVRAAGDDTMVETAIVGDPIGFLRVAAATSRRG